MSTPYNLDRLAGVIRSAAKEVCSTMLMVDIESEPEHQEDDGQSFYGVISFIGLAGACAGSGRLSCSPALACRLSGALLACEFTSVNEDVLDAMAEISNMIVGNVKSALEEDLGPIGLSIPTVIFGRNYQTRSSGVGEWAVVPFRFGADRLEVRVCLAPQATPSAKRPDFAPAMRPDLTPGVVGHEASRRQTWP